MRAALLIFSVVLAACSERSKPNTPRDAVRGFAAAVAEFDYDAVQRFVSGDELDLRYLEAFLAMGRTNLAFRTRFLASYGKEGWAEFNDNEEATISVTEKRDLDRLDSVRYEIDGQRAIGTLPDDPQRLHLVSDGRRWTVDLRKTMALGPDQLRTDAETYRRIAEVVRKAMPRIGAEGVTPATLDTELAAEMAVVFRAMGRMR